MTNAYYPTCLVDMTLAHVNYAHKPAPSHKQIATSGLLFEHSEDKRRCVVCATLRHNPTDSISIVDICGIVGCANIKRHSICQPIVIDCYDYSLKSNSLCESATVVLLVKGIFPHETPGRRKVDNEISGAIPLSLQESVCWSDLDEKSREAGQYHAFGVQIRNGVREIVGVDATYRPNERGDFATFYINDASGAVDMCGGLILEGKNTPVAIGLLARENKSGERVLVGIPISFATKSMSVLHIVKQALQ